MKDQTTSNIKEDLELRDAGDFQMTTEPNRWLRKSISHKVPFHDSICSYLPFPSKPSFFLFYPFSYRVLDRNHEMWSWISRTSVDKTKRRSWWWSRKNVKRVPAKSKYLFVTRLHSWLSPRLLFVFIFQLLNWNPMCSHSFTKGIAVHYICSRIVID